MKGDSNKMNIDIQKIVNDHIKTMEENGVIEKTIKENIEKTVIKAITDALSGYQLKRDIEEKISKEVSVVVSNIGFTAYNSFIAEKVKEITESVCNEDIAKKIQKTFDDILIIKHNGIKLSEIFTKYKEYINEEVDESEKDELKEFYVKFEEDKYWYNIELAKKKPEIGRSCGYGSISFTLHKTSCNPTVGLIGFASIDNKDIKSMIRFGRLSDFELLLVNLLYNETPIEIDVTSKDEIDNTYDIDY